MFCCCNSRILICIKIATRALAHQEHPKQTTRHVSRSPFRIPLSHSRGNSSFRDTTASKTPVLRASFRAPHSRSRGHSSRSEQTSTSTNLLDFHVQFSKQNSFNSRSRLCRQIISHFEHCNSLLLQCGQLQMAT